MDTATLTLEKTPALEDFEKQERPTSPAPRRFLGDLRPMHILLPGLFLFVLGLGNIIVGSFKHEQYNEVLQELQGVKQSELLVPVSPLRRIQLARETESRNYQRQKKAQARRDFYGVVTYGGKVFVVASLFFLLAAAVLSYPNIVRLSRRT